MKSRVSSSLEPKETRITDPNERARKVNIHVPLTSCSVCDGKHCVDDNCTKLNDVNCSEATWSQTQLQIIYIFCPSKFCTSSGQRESVIYERVQYYTVQSNRTQWHSSTQKKKNTLCLTLSMQFFLFFLNSFFL